MAFPSSPAASTGPRTRNRGRLSSPGRGTSPGGRSPSRGGRGTPVTTPPPLTPFPVGHVHSTKPDQPAPASVAQLADGASRARGADPGSRACSGDAAQPAGKPRIDPPQASTPWSYQP